MVSLYNELDGSGWRGNRHGMRAYWPVLGRCRAALHATAKVSWPMAYLPTYVMFVIISTWQGRDPFTKSSNFTSLPVVYPTLLLSPFDSSPFNSSGQRMEFVIHRCDRCGILTRSPFTFLIASAQFFSLLVNPDDRSRLYFPSIII